MPEIQPLEPVSLREAWPSEASDFTPWLVEHIGRLGEELHLELARQEVTLPGDAGRVDILAQQVGTGAKVVIENQLEQSDDSHCLRLLGYAAGAEASILIWVARNFTPYHRSILEWLNAADTIHVYAVEVHAYRVGGVLAADFRTVVEPATAIVEAPLSAKNSNTLYAEFYRPLVARLRQGGLQPGGWRGKWRQFHTGHQGAFYGLGLVEGKAQVFLSFKGPDRQERYRALLQYRAEIDGKIEGALSWQEEGPGSWGESLVLLERAEAVSLTSPEAELEGARRWMADKLVSLRAALQPRLDELTPTADADGAPASSRADLLKD